MSQDQSNDGRRRGGDSIQDQAQDNVDQLQRLIEETQATVARSKRKLDAQDRKDADERRRALDVKNGATPHGDADMRKERVNRSVN